MSKPTLKTYFNVKRGRGGGDEGLKIAKRRKLIDELIEEKDKPATRSRTAKKLQALSSPITAKQCRSPAKAPPPVSSPSLKCESRGAAALRKALEKSPSHLHSPPVKNDSSSVLSPRKVLFSSFGKAAANPGSAIAVVSENEYSKVPESPKLGKFDVFEFSSPQKKPSASRRLNYSHLAEMTPAEVKLNAQRKDRSCSNAPEDASSSSSKLPAYKTFQHLAQSTSEGGRPMCSLPYSYQLLSEQFRAMDTISSMLHKRSEICTFDKLKKSVQQMTKRNFEKKNVGQIVYVYPGAFFLRQEKNVPGTFDSDKTKRGGYQLTVEPSAHEGDEEGVVDKLPPGKSLLPQVLVKRRKKFVRNLTDIVMGHHKKFLRSLDPPVEIPDEKLFRWHPEFQLDLVPAVPESQLPHPPVTESYATAKDVLNATKNKMADRLSQALEAVSNEPISEQTKPARYTSGVLKGVSSSLLERIRLKEATKAKADMSRNPLEEKKLAMINRLPEICRIIRSLFVSEGKSALLFEDVTRKISESHSSGLALDQVEEHLDFFLSFSKDWVKKIYLKKSHYLKIIDKNAQISVILNSVDIKRKEIKNC